MLRFVEHGHAVAHVLEGDAEFLLALADFVQQPSVLHGDNRLSGEVLQQRDFLIGERADFLAVDVISPSTVSSLRSGTRGGPRPPRSTIARRDGIARRSSPSFNRCLNVKMLRHERAC